MTKDRQGFLWIATDNGLNRFDGYSFLQYDCRPRSKHKIRYNRTYAILPDRAGNLLIGYDYPQNGALDHLDPLVGAVTSFSYTKNAGFHGTFQSFFQAPDGSLYFLVLHKDQAVVYQFNEQTGQYNKVLEAAQPGVNYDCYAAFLKAADGTFWFAYNWNENKGPFLIHSTASGRTLQWYDERNFSRSPGSSSGNVTLTEAADGKIWCTLYGTGVYGIDTTATVFKRHPQLPAAGYYFAKDKKGNLLAYQTKPADITQGAYLLTATGQLVNYSWIYANQAIVDPVFSDDFTAGFLAGSGNGFNSYQLRSERFQTFLGTNLGIAPYGISTRGMVKSGTDKLFIATERDGLFELDLKTNAVTRTGDRLPQLASLNKIVFPRNLLAQGDSVLWIPCVEGVLKYAIPQSAITVYKSGFKEAAAINFGTDGKLWMALRDNRLAQLNPVSGEITVYYNKDGSQPLERSQPGCMLTARDGTLWIGTAMAGLIKINPEKGQSQRFTANADDPAGFNSNHITCIYEDEKGLLWLGTMEGGVHVFDPVTSRVVAIYAHENGLRNNNAVGILPDNQGNYWVSTFNGLSYLDTKRKTFRNYTTADGLSHNEFNRFSCFLDRENNRFYFGGMNGINAFDQYEPQSVANDAPLLISEMTFAGGRDSMIVRSEGIVDGTTLTLLPGSRFLHLSLALGAYYNSAGNQFSYKIEGLDKGWNYLGMDHDLRIDYLPAGTYTLRLRGADDRGNWSTREIALRLIVLEYWYKRWWAYLIYATLLVAGSFYFYRFQLRRSIAEKEAQRLQQLDVFKSQFFTNITHEFRTPLTVILGTTDALIDENNGPAMTGNHPHSPLQLIKRNGEGLLRLINQILDLAKIESNAWQFKDVQGDVLPYLRYLCESVQTIARIQNIQLTVESPESEIVLDYDPECLRQIVHNLLSNALKFTPAGGRVTVRADLILPDSPSSKIPTFKITVSDTGTGIAPQDLPYIFDRFYQAGNLIKAGAGGTGIGLALTKELVQLMGGAIVATSALDKGTTVTASWPVTRHARKEPEFAAPGKIRAAADPDTSELRTIPVAPVPERPSLLLLEDNLDVVTFLTTCLQDKYQLDFTYNGQTGIARALETVPDLIISDVMMPGKDGFEVCETLKNDLRTSHIPLVLLTARADFESRIAGLQRGADAYIAKPFRREELLLTLHNLLRAQTALKSRFDKNALVAAIPHPANAGIPALSFDPEDVFVQKLRQYVLDNLDKTDLSVEDLSRAMTMSYQNLHRKLSVLTGLAPVQFIRLLRLAHARTLLQTTGRSIGDIAGAVGFNDAKYFSRVFTEEYGKPPSAERTSQIPR